MSKMEEIYEMYLTLKKKSNDKNEKWQYYCPLILKVENLLEDIEKTSIEYVALLMMLGYAYYEKSRFLIEINDISALENLERSIDYLKKFKNHVKIVYIYLKTINLHSYIQSKNGKLEEAKMELLEAEKQYFTLDPKESLFILNSDEVFKVNVAISKPNLIKLEKLVTNNLQILSWIFNKQNLTEMYVLYHYKVLKRQLEYKDGCALVWVQKCSRLSSYFLSKQRFKEARHHLSASLSVLQDYEKELNQSDSNLTQYYADIARYWVKYVLFLYNASLTLKNDKCVKDMSKGDSNDNDSIKSTVQVSTNEDLFYNLNLNEIESQVTDKLIVTTEEARKLFVFAQNWLKKSKEFYNLYNYPFDFVNSILDMSELYRYLAFYENDIESQYNVQKRRIDVLETLSTILKDVSPSCYSAVSIELLRALSEAQMELLSLNIEKLYKLGFTNEMPQSLLTEDFNIKKMEAITDIYVKVDSLKNKIKMKK